MKIGELAERGACNVETVRFYEKEGLLEAPVREANGYRQYNGTHLAQLLFIRHCRSLDMGLPEVRTLRNLQAHPESACGEINHLIDTQIGRVNRQVAALRQLEKQLQSLRDTCQDQTKVGECAILRNLQRSAGGNECSCHPSAEGDG
jgi:Cd(II)/Pb(II)-responsive transcriptional regulator